MTQKQRHRLWYLLSCLLGIVGIAIIVTIAFRENMMYFVTPSELISTPDHGRRIRLGGLVEKGSIAKEMATLTTSFIVTDNNHSIPVSYTGIVPDLFREGQGVIVEGQFDEKGCFNAERLLAKHDENYIPPEIADKIGKKTP